MMLPSLAQREALRTAPAAPFVMHQRWQDLLFLHWSFAPEVIHSTLSTPFITIQWPGKVHR